MFTGVSADPLKRVQCRYVAIALSEGEVEQETPKATGHQLGPVGRH